MKRYIKATIVSPMQEADVNDRYDIACDPNTPLSVVMDLARTRLFVARARVALDPNATSDMLHIVHELNADDYHTDRCIDACILQNPNCPEDLKNSMHIPIEVCDSLIQDIIECNPALRQYVYKLYL